jgi:hypothetical protein
MWQRDRRVRRSELAQKKINETLTLSAVMPDVVGETEQ